MDKKVQAKTIVSKSDHNTINDFYETNSPVAKTKAKRHVPDVIEKSCRFDRCLNACEHPCLQLENAYDIEQQMHGLKKWATF